MKRSGVPGIVLIGFCFLITMTLFGTARVFGGEATAANKVSEKAVVPPDGKAVDDDQIQCEGSSFEGGSYNAGNLYKDLPFREGEEAVYEARYFGALAGYATFRVLTGEQIDGIWHRRYDLDAKTGDWYKWIFVAHDTMRAWSRPDFAVRKFHMKQDEGKLLGKTFRQTKWLQFDHEKCQVTEEVTVPGKRTKVETHELVPGAIDALAVIYELRTRTYEIGKVEKALVYTSEKNWWLEAEPVKKMKMTVPAGTFDVVKLKLSTYLGKELQQKGDVYAYLDQSSPHRLLVALEGEVKIGSVTVRLSKFKPGRSIPSIKPAPSK